MKFGLGIDTGGTYTDAVIYDFEENKILYSAKSITIKEDLTMGINNVLQMLPIDTLRKVKLVSLSTTLATNACVEGKGCRAVLVLIGCDEDIVKQYGPRHGLPDAGEMIFLSGGHTQQGDVLFEPDWSILEEKILKIKDKVDGFAVVELWGIRNNSFENKARRIIMDLTGKPVVCAHELTAEVNSLKRAASSLLNAQFIPLINEFINSVKTSLKMLDIHAPLVIVRGDGTLMSEEFAREKPVETLLSGPSASVAGGIKLTGNRDCLIIDMGGTTSDLAVVRDGKPTLAAEGVNVGSWKTGTASIRISTFGLGGDSLVRYNEDNDVVIGPVRAAPLSWLAFRWPEAVNEIKSLFLSKKRHTVSLCEFFYLVKDISLDTSFSPEERKTVEFLKNGPMSILKLSQAVGSSIYSSFTKRLEQLGIIMRSGLTPTDIMHLTKAFCAWNSEAALMGAEIMAYQLNITLEELIKKINTAVKQKLYFNIIKTLLENENPGIVKNGITEQLYETIMMGYNKGSSILACNFSTRLDLLGIGAPIHIFLPDVAEALGTRCLIPDNASVANAVGAITASVAVEETVIIRPKYEVSELDAFTCYSSSERKSFAGYKEALEWAKGEAARIAAEKAHARGSGKVDISLEVKKNEVELSGVYASDSVSHDTENNPQASEMLNSNKLFLETIVKARAVGTLKWL